MSQNRKAPVLDSLRVLKGDPIHMQHELGKKVFVVEFWATWCPPCKASIPHLTELAHKYKAAGVQFIGVTNETPGAALDRFIKGMGHQMDYTVAVDEDGIAQEGYMAAYRCTGIPTAFIVNRQGSIVWHGHPMDPQFEVNVAKAAAEKPAEDAAEPLPNVKGMTQAQIAALSVADLKRVLKHHHVDYSDCLEKSDLVQRVQSAL